MYFYTDSLYGPIDSPRALFFTLTVSLICHLMFFVVLIFAPGFIPEKKTQPRVINISLVTQSSNKHMAAKAVTDKAMGKPRKKAPVIRPSKRINNVINKSSKSVPVTTSPKKVKRSLKKKTFKSSKIVKSAISKLEKKVEKARPDTITKAIDRLKKKTGQAEAIERIKKKVEKGPLIPGGSGVGSKQALKLIDLYRYEIALKVQQNWAYSGQLAGDNEDLIAEIAFTVMPNGEIRDIWFDKRSGSRYLDDSSKKAVLKSNPVHPHPPGVAKTFIQVGLRFTPRGVK